MSSVIEGYNYDIFISYRQKDNKGERWVSEFVEALKTELESTFKEEISVYFDINPHDGLLETHDVDASLKEKLKCLIFIPIISRTYCDPKSFAWEHEFKAFVEQVSKDQFGLKVKLPTMNVVSRVLPVRIHDLYSADIKLCESILGGPFRGVDFIYRSAGVNRPLRASEDHPHDNLNKTYYRDQINKVANAINDIILCLDPESKEKINQPDKSFNELRELNESSEWVPGTHLSDDNSSLSLAERSPESIPDKPASGKRLIITLILIGLILGVSGLWGWLKRGSYDSFKTPAYSYIPVETTLMGSSGQIFLFDISPDGNLIAYCTAKGIEIKSLSNFSTKILEGTAGATYITFSPDGQFLAFNHGRRIRKIGLSGSPMSTVYNQGGICLSWGIDGNIYFSRGLGSEGIWRVSANGGEPEKLTYINDTLEEISHTWPQLLPDSRTLLYTSVGPSGGSIDSKIVIHRLDNKKSKILLNSAVYGRYLSNRNLLYANNDGNIFILPFNMRKSKTSGESKAVLSGVHTATWSGCAFLSVSKTGNLIFLPRNSSPLNIIEVLDRSGETINKDSIPLETLEMIGFGWTDFKISPSGDYLAFTGRTFGSSDIWILNLNSKEAERVTLESSEEEYPVWSPEGRYIAYTSTMAGEHQVLIQDLRMRGNPKQVLTWPRYCHIRDWSPDGKWLAMDDFSTENGMDLYVISIDGGELIPVSVTKANEQSGKFSPDGKWLTFTSDQNGATETYIVSFPELKDKRQFLTSRETSMIWAPNGKQIYFRSGGNIFVQEVIIENEIKKGEAVRLFGSQSGSFAVSPDGQKFYLVKPNLKRANPPLCLITNWFQEL